MSKIIKLGLLAVLLAGCSGHVEQFVDDRDYPAKPSDNSESADGIRVYMPAYMKVKMQYTTRIDSVTKVATTDCDPTIFAQVKQMCDYSRPLRVKYKHGLFETNTFSVTVGADGCFLSVNAQSTPAASTVATFIPAVITAGAAVGLYHDGHPAPRAACTGDPVMIAAPRRCNDDGTCPAD